MNKPFVVLEKLQVGFQQSISDGYMNDCNVDMLRDEMRKTFDYNFRSFVWCEPQLPIEIKYPSDWWQAFKQRWFPKWLLRKYPVCETVHIIDRKVVYPDLVISIKDKKHNLHIDFETIETK